MSSPYDVQAFQTDVIEASHQVPMVVDFWAEWCGPCRILGPILERLAEEAEGRWRLAKVDTEAFPDEAQQYGVRGIPNVKLFVDGRPVDEFVGALPETQVREWLERAIPSDADRKARGLVREARETVFTEPRRALELLEGVRFPSDVAQTVRDVEEIAHLVLRLGDPEALEESESGQAYLEGLRRLSEQDFDAALDRFIAALRKDRTVDDEGPRRACQVLFRFLGGEHPAVQAHRSAFASALYV